MTISSPKDNKDKPNLDAPSSAPPRRKIFDLDSQILSNSETAPDSETVATATKKIISSTTMPPFPESGSGKGGKKRGPKPTAEPLEHWTVKVKSAHLRNIDEMLEDAPRFVLKQDLVDYILTDFFERNKKLPETLRKRKSPNK